jgi:hypothetical protein
MVTKRPNYLNAVRIGSVTSTLKTPALWRVELDDASMALDKMSRLMKRLIFSVGRLSASSVLRAKPTA